MRICTSHLRNVDDRRMRFPSRYLQNSATAVLQPFRLLRTFRSHSWPVVSRSWTVLDSHFLSFYAPGKDVEAGQFGTVVARML